MKRFLYYFFCTVNYLPIYSFVYYLILLLTYLFVYFYFFLGGLKQEMSEQFLQLHSKYDSSPRLSVKGVVNNCCLLCYKVVHNAEGTNVHSVF